MRPRPIHHVFVMILCFFLCSALRYSYEPFSWQWWVIWCIAVYSIHPLFDSFSGWLERSRVRHQVKDWYRLARVDE